jgi:hypothetical protein
VHADHVTDLDGHRKCGDVDDTATEVSLSKVRKRAGGEVFRRRPVADLLRGRFGFGGSRRHVYT